MSRGDARRVEEPKVNISVFLRFRIDHPRTTATDYIACPFAMDNDYYSLTAILAENHVRPAS